MSQFYAPYVAHAVTVAPAPSRSTGITRLSVTKACRTVNKDLTKSEVLALIEDLTRSIA